MNVFGWLSLLFALINLSSGGGYHDVISITAEDSHFIQKRSSEEEESPSNEPAVSNLATVVHLNTSQLNLLLTWTGEGSRNMFCISKSNAENEASTVYFSDNYGKTFQNISSKFILNDGNKSKISYFNSHKYEQCTLVFADVVHRYIFTTRDCGTTIDAFALDFSPDVIQFDQRSKKTFFVHDLSGSEKKLYVTQNFGHSFSLVQDYVESFILYYNAPETVLYVVRTTPDMEMNNVFSSKSYFQNSSEIEVVHSDVIDFEIHEDYLFVKTKDIDHGHGYKQLSISKISTDGSHGRFVLADFGDDRPIHDFFIVDVTTDNQVLICANFDSVLSNLYSSVRINGHEALFSLSLQRVLFYNPATTWTESWLRHTSGEKSFVDIYKVEGLRGVYIANQILTSYFESAKSDIRPENLQSLITFDLGGIWSPIREPRLDEQDRKLFDCSENKNCSLHLSQYLSNKYPNSRSIPVLSKSSAVGIILGTGNIGNRLHYKSNVYLSADAGLSWHQILQGSYYYSIGDYGGIIVAVKYYKTDGPTNELLYSTNEGITWKSIVFYKKPLRIFSLLAQPGENSTIFTMFGTEKLESVRWIVVSIDLKSVFLRNCTSDDYKYWSPSDSSYGKHKNCLLGRKDIFERRIVHSNCYNGPNYVRISKVENCHCERSDFQCDFGFIPDESSPETCIANPEFKHIDLYEQPRCLPGETFLRKTGYVKIPGDTCIGGKEKEFLPMNISCPLEPEDEFLIVNERVKVSRINLWNMSQIDELPLRSISDVTTVEYDIDNNCAIWSDGKKKQIRVQCFNSTLESRILINDSISSVQGMAFDWISRNLYFVDGKLKKIEVVRLDDGSIRKVLLDSKILMKPRGIAVHPVHGYLYYTDWYEGGPSIGRTNMDGTSLKTLIKGSQIVWPNYLSIDFIANRVYWTDSKLGHIGSCDLHGGNLKFIDSAPNIKKRHPFSVAVYKEFIFWDDWVFKSVFVADKNSGKGRKEILTKMVAAMDVKAFSKNLRSKTNACSENKDACTHFCIPLPESHKSRNKYKCICPDGMKEVFDENTRKSSCLCPHQTSFEGKVCSNNATHEFCEQGNFHCNNKKCIRDKFRCDGENDCGDHSDETDCDHYECSLYSFKCANNKCINSDWRCDGENDCKDNSDEMGCEFKECAEGYFKCDNDQCIKSERRCDLDIDCSDGSDEKNCNTTQECTDEEFKCPFSTKCFPRSWKCDGFSDCNDGSDETNCETKNCRDWQFQCTDGTCIFEGWVCDGQFDCSDKSDELNCNSTSASFDIPIFQHDLCKNNMFKCSSGQCIPIAWKCDGAIDCPDKSDELNCGIEDKRSTTSLPEPTRSSLLNMFTCKSGKKIWQSWVCNGRNDCPDDGDENPSLCQEKTKCATDERRCDFSGECIKLDKLCDGSVNCADGSDEKGCDYDHKITPTVVSLCDPLLFACDNYKKCLPDNLVCNGVKNCEDGSDEINCHQYQSYQVRGLLLDEDLISAESLTIHWWIADIASTKHLLFQPKYRIAGYGHHIDWSKVSWQSIDNASYTFRELHPFTKYDLAVDIKFEDKVYESMNYITGQTYQSIPSSPLNLKAVQEGKRIKLSWVSPSRPNGIIRSYTIEISPPSNPPMILRTGINILEYKPNVEFESGVEYTFSVTAENSIASGNKSLPFSLVFDEEAFKYSIRRLEVMDIKTHSAVLRWTAIGSISQFRIELQSPKNPYANYENIVVDGSSFNYTLQNLSPAEEYIAKISPLKNNIRGPSYEAQFITPGTPIPIPQIEQIRSLSERKNVVQVDWRISSDNMQEARWKFALYYGSSEQELLKEGIRNSTDAFSLKLKNLNACQNYIFRVNIIEPYGTGHISPAKTFTTPYSLRSPPKELAWNRKENDLKSVKVTWAPPCSVGLRDQQLGYYISIHNLITEKNTSIHLTKTNYIQNEYTIRNIHYGGLYEVRIRTDIKDSMFTPPLSFKGPEIPPPIEFTGRTEKATGNQLIFWNPSLSSEDLGDKFTYNLYLSKNDDFKDSKIFSVSRPPYVISHDLLEPGEVYYLSVETITFQGYKSMKSPPITLERPSAAAIIVSESGAAGIMIPIFLFVIALVVILGVYVNRHRKLQSRFQQFASRYSTASGATILSQTILDEEDDEDNDSPIIRGFSDNEPLVIS